MSMARCSPSTWGSKNRLVFSGTQASDLSSGMTKKRCKPYYTVGLTVREPRSMSKAHYSTLLMYRAR